PSAIRRWRWSTIHTRDSARARLFRIRSISLGRTLSGSARALSAVATARAAASSACSWFCRRSASICLTCSQPTNGMTASTNATRTTLLRKPIAKAIDRVDRGELTIDRLEFPADPLDVRGDGRVVDHDVRVAHQLLAILDVAGKARERMHQP